VQQRQQAVVTILNQIYEVDFNLWKAKAGCQCFWRNDPRTYQRSALGFLAEGSSDME
jgi:hypothetical protein